MTQRQSSNPEAKEGYIIRIQKKMIEVLRSEQYKFTRIVYKITNDSKTELKIT